jgi:hemoglobin
MIRRHLNRHLDQQLRRRRVALLLQTADELQMPDDPEFRSALVGYPEWGSRLAVINCRPGAMTDESTPMARRGWERRMGHTDLEGS